MVLGSVLSSCFKDDDEKVAEEYADWRDLNTAWFTEQAGRVEDGVNYYTKFTAPWDPNAEVLIHWFNDTNKTMGNLKPKFTSMAVIRLDKPSLV